MTVFTAFNWIKQVFRPAVINMPDRMFLGIQEMVTIIYFPVRPYKMPCMSEIINSPAPARAFMLFSAHYFITFIIKIRMTSLVRQ